MQQVSATSTKPRLTLLRKTTASVTRIAEEDSLKAARTMTVSLRPRRMRSVMEANSFSAQAIPSSPSMKSKFDGLCSSQVSVSRATEAVSTITEMKDLHSPREEQETQEGVRVQSLYPAREISKLTQILRSPIKLLSQAKYIPTSPSGLTHLDNYEECQASLPTISSLLKEKIQSEVQIDYTMYKRLRDQRASTHHLKPALVKTNKRLYSSNGLNNINRKSSESANGSPSPKKVSFSHNVLSQYIKKNSLHCNKKDVRCE